MFSESRSFGYSNDIQGVPELCNIACVGTHSGVFHADDVFSFIFLKKAINENIRLVRSRDKVELNSCDLVFDVGDGMFDHHKIGGRVRENGIPFASLGLLWDAYGRTYLKKEGVSDPEFAHKMFDILFIQGIDAVDNGHTLSNDHRITSVSGVVDLCNQLGSNDEIFKEVAEYCKSIWELMLSKVIAMGDAYKVLRDKYVKNSELLILEDYIPFENIVSFFFTDVKFVIFKGSDGDWRVMAARDEPNSFVNRKNMPASWGGKRDEELSEVTGVPGCVFCHGGLWLAINRTREGALALAQIAIRDSELD